MLPSIRRFLVTFAAALVVCFSLTASAQTGAEAGAEPALVADAEGSGEAVAAADGSAAEGSGESVDAAPAAGEEASGIEEAINNVFSEGVAVLASVLFVGIPGVADTQGNNVPFIVAWLFFGAVFFTLAMGFINIRAFKHALEVVRGTFDDPNAEGEVNHFQALSSALSATVGLGNIAGVAIAVSTGGPGAVFWMIVAALFGMTSKFVECTLGQKYRRIDSNGTVLGGPMRYLEDGLAEKGMRPLGKVLAVLFAVFCIGGSFGGGNMFQANQAYLALEDVTPFHIPAPMFGIVMMALVGVVILGGIKRIASTAEKIVPFMCGIYLVAAGFVIAVNLSSLDEAIAAIISDAFTGQAIGGGIIGVMVMGIKRAAFSNEAGIGSASIAHAAARTKEPVREGLVALLEPFIDTVVVCLATGLVIVISGVADGADPSVNGAVLTSDAFRTVISWFPALLSLAIALFAFSTMISWSYYGERCWTNLFGPQSTIVYRIIFLCFIFIGSVSSMSAVVDFSDLMILSMAFPNVLGMYILSGTVRRDLRSYMARLNDGQFKRYK